MTSQELYKLIHETILPESLAIMQTKGEAYSGREDTLDNFKRCAKLADVPIEKAWFVYFVKHFDALNAFIRGDYCDSEPIKGRIIDMQNYLWLLAGILHEQNRLESTHDRQSDTQTPVKKGSNTPTS